MRELKRGIYTRVEKKPGEYLSSEDLMLAMPCQSGQFHAGELDEVVGLPVSHHGIEPMMPVMKNGACEVAPEIQISSILERVRWMLREAKVALPPGTRAEISHPYGLEVVKKFGAVMIDIVNREYCKKLIVQLAGQAHPRHKHVQKEETFQVLAGEGEAEVAGKVSLLRPGDSVLIHRGVEHSFRTQTGMIMEEISTTHIQGDSIYEDRNIPSNPAGRKTSVPI
jgi:N-acetylneuraminate synthase